VQGGTELRSKAHSHAKGAPTRQTEPMAGTGPYQFKERSQGEFVRFERVPYDHWRVKPDFPEFEFRWIKEPSTRLAALLTGELQMASLPEDLLQRAQKENFKVVKSRVAGPRILFRPYGL